MTPNVPSDLWKRCFTCRDYADHRREVIAQPLADKATREHRSVEEVVDEFMMAAHLRHVRNCQPLRPGGPTRIIDPYLGRVTALAAHFAEKRFGHG